MQLWEYAVVEWRGTTERIEELRYDGELITDWGHEGLPELLRQFGDTGWELASLYPGNPYVRMIFKRTKGGEDLG